jgi:electron transfer flavoprotein beta subunit
MKIVVPVKQVPSLVDDLEVNDAGTGLDEDSLTFVINEFDEHALEQAVLLKEAGSGSVTVIGVDTTEELEGVLHLALARGADSVARIPHDFEPGLSSHTQAQMLSKAIGELGADLILTGVQAADDRDGNLGPMIAAHLGWPYVGVVAGIKVNGAVATVHKEYPGGVMAEFEVELPAVVGIQAAAQPPRYAPISKIRQMAKEASIQEVTVEAEAGAGSQVRRMYLPESTSHAEMLGSNAGEVAQKILNLLSERGLL